MSKKLKSTAKNDLIAVLVLAACGYFIAADTVFAFRHPWATKTEHLIYVGKVLTFQTVKYNEARPRDE